jgi:hypothetical protein
MMRTEAPGNAANLYTIGNPTLGIPATQVRDTEMNNIQEELAEAIEEAGIALDQTGVTFTQLRDAILTMISRGGTQSSLAIANNTGPATVTGLIFNSTNIASARVLYHLERRTDTQDVTEHGELHIAFDNENTAWSVVNVSHGDDAEVVFSITPSGQVEYTSNDLTGATYSGKLRWTNIITVAQ